MTEQVDLLPCPFCVTEFPPVTTTDKCGATVICTGCSALGPTRGAEAEAITAWNTHAAATEIEALRAQVARCEATVVKLVGASRDVANLVDPIDWTVGERAVRRFFHGNLTPAVKRLRAIIARAALGAAK
jgi:hypothetical protein